MINHKDAVMQACVRQDEGKLFSLGTKVTKFQEKFEADPESIDKGKSLLDQAKALSSLMSEKIDAKRKSLLENKPQHGAFFRAIKKDETIDIEGSWEWLRWGGVPPHVEGYLCAAQEQALFTTWHEKNITKRSEDDSCRLCHKEVESVFHILSGCDTLAHKEYLHRHDQVAKLVHHTICRHFKIPVPPNWSAHKPDEVIVTSEVEIVWDQFIDTDRPVGANRPDIIVRDKKAKETLIIDVSCPCDLNVTKKENEKLLKYVGLKTELSRMWKCKTKVVPIVIGGQGIISKKFKDYLKEVPAKPKPQLCQKSTILESNQILRKFLCNRQ